MKVTKIIREYIEERVDAIFAEPTPIEKEYNEKITEFNKYIEGINNKINKFIDEQIKEIENNNPYNFYIDRSSTTTFIYDSTYWSHRNNGELADKAKKARTAREQQCTKAKKDIMIDLELGATNKEDLEKMFKELTNKYNTMTIEE